MKRDIKVIGIYATRQNGKDTFMNLLNKLYPNKFVRFAFADKLKDKCDYLCYDMFGKHTNELTETEKEIIRPIWIAVGMAYRAIDGLYWVKLASENIDFANDYIPTSSDTRFPNECDYFKEKFGNNYLLIGIKRDGAPEPTDEEKKWEAEMEKRVECWINWPTVSPEKSLDELNPYVIEFFNKYFI